MQGDSNRSVARPGKSARSSTTVLDRHDIWRRLPATRFPVMSQVLSRLLDACFADTASADELVAIVSLDAGIAAKVITVASSSSIAEPTLPCNLAQCVKLVGLSTVKTIAVNESATRVFGLLSDDQEFALTQSWFHALKCALLAKALAAAQGYPDPEEAYLAGLMHDIGSLALSAMDPGGYPQLLSKSKDDEYLCQLELERYRVTHADVGSWFFERWQLGSFLSDSILYHHVPAEGVATAHPLIKIILLSDYISQIDMSSKAGEAMEFARLCGVPFESLMAALDRANEELKRIADELGIGRGRDAARPVLAPDTPALRNEHIRELGGRLEEKLWIDGIQRLLEEAGDVDSVLRGISQAVLILFGLQPSLFFLREADSEAFVGKALLPRHAKVNQLSFLAGHSDSAISEATLGQPIVWFVQDGWRKPLDAQLARLLDAEGIVCIPIGAGSQCKGLVISAINSRYHADALHEKMGMLRSFGKLAYTVLENADAGGKPGIADIPAESGASREQIRHLLHEVSNPLSIVRNYLATLEMSLGQNEIGKRELRIVAEEISRVSQILDDFQQTPRAPAIAAGPVELHELLRRMLDLCKGSRLVPPLVNIETNFHATSPAVVANPEKLRQVLINLIKNAFEAMPNGGVFSLSTSSWSSGGVESYVEITLEDSGPGLPEEIQRNIFHPVTSTKGGQHFGIGLSIAGQLVREMSGLISHHSGESGCRFRIILPVVTHEQTN